MKKEKTEFVRCTECINSKFQTDYCYMESGSFGEQGYCKYCPCNNCDKTCTEPDLPKSIDERRKFKRI